MSTQVTINRSFYDKLSKIDELVGDAVEEKIVSLAQYGIQISPVDTGTWVESFSIRPRGSGGGRTTFGRRDGKLSLPPGAKQSLKEQSKRRVANDVAILKDQIVERGGAVIINRSEEAQSVEREFAVFARMKAKFV